MTIAVGAVRGTERMLLALTGRSSATAAAIDYRFAALGSQVPDLIDKPLKYHLFPDSLPDSHIYGHTLLLPLCIILLGVVVAHRYGDLRLLVLGVGCLTHPLVDPTNTYPKTLFWPLLGTDFPVATQAYRNLYQIPLDIALICVMEQRSPSVRVTGRRRGLSFGTGRFRVMNRCPAPLRRAILAHAKQKEDAHNGRDRQSSRIHRRREPV